MNYLSHYTEAALKAAHEKAGAFYAFSNGQFNEKKKPDTLYVTLGAGLVCPKDTANELIKDINAAVSNGIAQDLAENDKDAIIRRELDNHEYCITDDISDTVQALDGYGFTPEEIQQVANGVRPVSW